MSQKQATVILLHKGRDSLDNSNHCPISLLPIYLKVLEKKLSTQLVEYLERNKLLSKRQYGFRPKLCTTTALPVVTDKIYENMDNKRISLQTLCDLSKAFNSINHQILIEKLKMATVYAFWFEDYLSKRSVCKSQNTVSIKASIMCGVPQSSILGPILFNLYVNMSSYFNTVPYTIC